MDKEISMKGKVGAAWSNPDGTISIRLNPFIMLDGSNPKLVLTLFPFDNSNRKTKAKSASADYDPFMQSEVLENHDDLRPY